MPIETDGEAWKDSGEIESLQNELVDFLKENRSLAFNARELSDEVVDTNWKDAHEKERKIQRIGEEQYYEELDDDDRPPFGSAIAEGDTTGLVISQLEQLVAEGTLEAREIPEEQHDIPYEDFGPATYYSYPED